RPVPPPDRDALADPLPRRHDALDPDGLPLAAPPAPGDPGLLEPQGPALRARRAQAGLRRAAGVLRADPRPRGGRALTRRGNPPRRAARRDPPAPPTTRHGERSMLPAVVRRTLRPLAPLLGLTLA